MNNHLTIPELAERLGKSADWVQRRYKAWPHMKVGRTPRFTPEQVEAIEAMFTITPTTGDIDNAPDGPPPGMTSRAWKARQRRQREQRGTQQRREAS